MEVCAIYYKRIKIPILVFDSPNFEKIVIKLMDKANCVLVHFSYDLLNVLDC